jgi:hypothetical protein
MRDVKAGAVTLQHVRVLERCNLLLSMTFLMRHMLWDLLFFGQVRKVLLDAFRYATASYSGAFPVEYIMSIYIKLCLSFPT